MNQVMPHNAIKLKLYEDTVPLFSRYQVENQIESAFSREVNYLEAASEVARQLKIRDLGGLVVIDFIDMVNSKNQRAVERRLQDAMESDRARVQIGKISRFGLLELSRQRLRSSISDANYKTCPRCDGTGAIRSVSSCSLSILRVIEEEALKENTEAVVAHLPLQTASFLLNEKRHEVNMIETRLATNVYIIPTNDLETPHYEIKRLRAEDIDAMPDMPSFKLKMEGAKKERDLYQALASNGEAPAKPIQQPVVGLDSIEMKSAAPAPTSKEEEKLGLFTRIWRSLFGGAEKKATPVKKNYKGKNRSNNRSSNNRNRNNQNRNRNNQNRNQNGGGKNGGNRSRHPNRRGSGANSSNNNQGGKKPQNRQRSQTKGASSNSAAKSGNVK